MESDLNPQSSADNNGEWTSGKSFSLHSSEDAILPTSSDAHVGEGVINGQDMALLQRPLLESPSGSDSSQGGDSIEGSMRDESIGSIDERVADKRDRVEPNHSELGVKTDLSAHRAIQTIPVFNSISSPNAVAPRLTTSQNATVAHFILGGSAPSTEDTIPGTSSAFRGHRCDDTTESEDKKRDCPSSNNVPFEVKTEDGVPQKKIRLEAGFGTDLNVSDVSTLAFVGSSTMSKKDVAERQHPFQHGLGDGKGVMTKLVDGTTADEVFKPAVQDGLASFPTHKSDVDISKLSPGIFDDAEDDNTFNPTSFQEPLKKSSSEPSVRPDLVAAILGSPSRQSFAPITVAAPMIAAVPVQAEAQNPKPEETKKAKSSRPVKKIWIAKKDQDATVAKFSGKVDLQRVLCEEHCEFLGKRCFLFTVQQLEYVLDEDEKAPDAPLKQKLRHCIIEQLAGDDLVNKNISQSSEDINKPESDKVVTGTAPGDQSFHCHSFESAIATAITAPNEVAPCSSSLNQSETPLDPDKERKATQLLEDWKKTVNEWRQRNAFSLDDEEQFPLSGPLSLFIPEGTQQFFQSINLQNAVEFLSLKKTETGLVVDMFQAWRNVCGLKQKQSLALAKHLVGISSRIEMAVASKAGIDANDMEWINDAMVIVTGAAKEFIIDDSKIYNAEQFIEMRTKFLADKLSDWRSRMGLPILKGSGKVAMISAWKAMLKDEVEIQKSIGKVVSKEELRSAEVEGQSGSPPKKRKGDDEHDRRKKKMPKDTPPRYITPAALKALGSESFFVDIFGEDERNMTMFRSVGITTAEKLLDADKGQNSDFLKAVINMKSEQTRGAVQSSSCIRLLYNWAAKVKTRLDDIEQGKTLDGSKNKANGDSPNQAKAEKPKAFHRERKSLSEDPFDALSASSRDFLASMGITTAVQFLSARTTDMANAFITWRAEKNMTALKGLGAVASISGWKKLVRNKAVSLGDDDLALLNQASNSKAPLQNKPSEKLQGSESKAFFENPITNDVDNAPNRHRFRALSTKSDIIFHFEVDTRLGLGNEERKYLTYIGSSMASEAIATTVSAITSKTVMTNVGEASVRELGRQPYDSTNHGMLDLGRDKLFRHEEEKEEEYRVSLGKMIGEFMTPSHDDSSNSDERLSKGTSLSEGQINLRLAQESRPPRSAVSVGDNSERSTHFNVFKAKFDGRTSFFLYLFQPIEKGQSVELHCLPERTPNSLSCSEEKRSETRDWIERTLGEVSVDDLLGLVDSLIEDVAPRIGMVDGLEKNDRAQAPAVSSRRFHWIMTRIYEQLVASAAQDDRCNAKLTAVRGFFWTKSVVDKIRNLPDWNADVIKREIRDEMIHEFSRITATKTFFESRDVWCRVALDLFNRSMDLLAGYFAEFDDFCPEDEIVRKLEELVSGAVEVFKAAAEKGEGSEKSKFDDLELSFATKVKAGSIIFPSLDEVLRQTYEQPYEDALSLCDEAIVQLNPKEKLRFVAVGERPGAVAWRTASEALYSDDAINLQWYVLNQVAAVVQVVGKCALTMTEPYDGHFQSFKSIDSKVLHPVRDVLEDPTTILDPFDCPDQANNEVSTPEDLAEQHGEKCRYQPNSSPFFHGFIWPVLRDSGWRLVAGDQPSDVIYCPPSAFKTGNRSGRMEKVARQRAQLASQSRCVGLGYLPKLTKRLVITCTAEDPDSELTPQVDSSQHTAQGVSVVQVLKAFQSSLLEDLTDIDRDDPTSVREKVGALVDAIELLFNDLAPHTFFEEEGWKLEADQRWCDVLDCQILVRVLLVLPTVIRDAELRHEQRDQIVCVARELLEFVARDYKTFFGESFHLPTEVYDDELSVPSALPKRIASSIRAGADDASNGGPQNLLDGKDHLEIVQGDERRELTDFIGVVMDQTIISYATEEDTTRKNRRVSVGHPCIVCRHCHGRHGEGKYFFGSTESMTTAATVIEKHLFRCTELNQSVKDEITVARSKHSEQRKSLPSGAQGAFFARLFGRLQSMGPFDGTESDFLTSSTPFIDELRHRSSESSQRDSFGAASAVGDAFKSHIDVMAFIQSTEPWKSTDSLVEAVETYYNCLEYGGKIVNTKRSPTNFCSEWLYSKIAP